MIEENNSNVTNKRFPTKEDLVQRFEEAKKRNQETYNKVLEDIRARAGKIVADFSEKS